MSKFSPKKLPYPLDEFGCGLQLANLLKITPSAVYHWIRNGKIPMLRAYEIEMLTDGKIHRDDVLAIDFKKTPPTP